MNIFSKQKNCKTLTYSLTLATAISLLEVATANAFSITFDYTYDDNKFFDPRTTEGQDRRNTLAQAGQYYTNYISDSLSAIASGSGIANVGGNGGANTWDAFFVHPATGNIEKITDLTVPADTIIVYVGGSDFSFLGGGGQGGYDYSGTSDFGDLIVGRGQVGALADPKTDIGLWGGSISFDTNIVIQNTTYNWHNTIDSAGLGNNEIDFLSVAIHELGHVLGFGGTSWQNQISSTNFTGTNALAVYQSETDADATSLPLKIDSLAHWNNGIESRTLGDVQQEVALDPDLAIGTRKILTNLDYAGLKDIGWEVHPLEDIAWEFNTVSVPFEFSPTLGILLMCGFFGSLFIRNRLRGKTKKLEIS